MMEENKRRVEEAQTKLAADIRRQEEERLVELQVASAQTGTAGSELTD